MAKDTVTLLKTEYIKLKRRKALDDNLLKQLISNLEDIVPAKMRISASGKPELKPEFIKRINKAEKQKGINVKDIAKHYRLG